MKTLLGSLLFITQLSAAFAQGSLTPPGAPGPTFKTLGQIEPRTPVDATNTPGNSSDQFVISQPGSYYLTTNIVGMSSKTGIEILANNVALDLNGFGLLGTPNSFDGIVVSSSSTNVTVRNGDLSGAGNVIRDCTISGCQRDGIDAFGSGALIRDNNLAGNNVANGFGNAGIAVIGANNRLEGNHVTGGGTAGSGILVSTSGSTNNIVVKNSVTAYGVNNYSIVPGNVVGPLITATGTITNSNPWANFSY